MKYLAIWPESLVQEFKIVTYLFSFHATAPEEPTVTQ
jgi:hypothetical protein